MAGALVGPSMQPLRNRSVGVYLRVSIEREQALEQARLDLLGGERLRIYFEHAGVECVVQRFQTIFWRSRFGVVHVVYRTLQFERDTLKHKGPH